MLEKNNQEVKLCLVELHEIGKTLTEQEMKQVLGGNGHSRQGIATTTQSRNKVGGGKTFFCP